MGFYANPEGFVIPFYGHVPVVTVNCPTTAVTAGDILTFNVNSNLFYAFYRWHITGGRIVEGDRTSSIKVDTAGLEATTLKVTAQMDARGAAAGLVGFSSCSVRILPGKPQSTF